MVSTRKLILISVAALLFVVPPACADLLFDHFGVTLTLGAAQTDTINGGTFTPFAAGTFAPTQHLASVDYVVDDWYGSWDFTDLDNFDSAGTGVEPAGAEPYDIEALYFDDTPTDLLIVIVTSFDPAPGHYETRVTGDPLVVSADLALDLGLNAPHSPDDFSYDFGVNMNPENRPASAGQNATSGGTTVGDDLYRTGNADWYIGTDANDVDAGGELTNFDPNWGSFGGTYLGEASVSYTEYDFGGGALECRYPTYIIEVMVPRALLPTLSGGDTVDIGWAEGCRNDGNDLQASLRFDDPPDVPEPGTLLLMGLGTLGMGWWKRRKKLAG